MTESIREPINPIPISEHNELECGICGRVYDQTAQSSICPHNKFWESERGQSRVPMVCVTEPEGDFDSGLKFVEKCEMEESQPLIELDTEVYNKVLAMNKAMGGDEWLGYLIGKYLKENDIYTIADIVIPKQKVSSTQVVVLEGVKRKDIIGTVHSHHNMGAFFSGTDTSYVGANHDVTIVASNKGWAQKVRRKLPCGAFLALEADLIIMYPAKTDLNKFVEVNKPKVTKEPVTVYQYSYRGPAYRVATLLGEQGEINEASRQVMSPASTNKYSEAHNGN